MRVLYVGQLCEGGTCLARADALAANGYEIVRFDTMQYLRGVNRIRAGLQDRFLWGPDVVRFNRDVLQAAREAGRLDVVWVDKGRWLRPSALDELKRMTGALVVHYTPDPAFTVHNSRHFEACVPLYDLCITNKRYELETYRNKGARNVLFVWQGIDDRFERIAVCGRFDARPFDCVFVGHVEPHYIATLECVCSVTQSLRVHGPGWQRVARGRSAFRAIAMGPVWGDDLPIALACGRVGVGVLSKLYPDAFTTRSFEVPAAGALLLAERTPDHEELFEEDREAVFFGSMDELKEKLRFYLRNDEVRRRIAEAGRRRVLGNYRWRHVLAPAIRRIEELRLGH